MNLNRLYEPSVFVRWTIFQVDVYLVVRISYSFYVKDYTGVVRVAGARNQTE